MRYFLRYRFVLPFYRHIFWPLAVRNRFIAALYYCYFDASFASEFQATLAGKKRFYERNAAREENLYLLRRNVHRLEKGLLMSPRRSLFATSYIGQAVHGLKSALQTGDPKLLTWAHDVIAEYFAVTERSPATESARKEFEDLSSGLSTQAGEERLVPYELNKEPAVTFEQMRQLALSRRSVRWFSNKKVAFSLVEQAMEIALLAPSACNRQPFKLLAFDDPESIAAIAKIPAGTAGFAENIPFLVAVVGELDAFSLEQDRHLIYTDGALASMSFMFALESLGLSSCPINWPASAKHDKRFQTVARTDDCQRVLMLIAIGYQDRDRLVARSAKRSVGEVLKLNQPLQIH